MSKQTFDFSEALRRMKEGKKVKRMRWESGSYLIIQNSEVIFHFQDKVIEFDDTETSFSLKEILATDWEEVVL